jgi:hypothetical protein
MSTFAFYFGIFYMPQTCNMGLMALLLLPSEGGHAGDFFTLKNPDSFGRV